MGNIAGVFLIVLFFLAFLGACYSASRSPKRPSEGDTPSDGPKPDRVPTREERMQAVGIATATSYEDMYSWGVHVVSVKMANGAAWCPFLDDEPASLGKLFVVSVEDVRTGGYELPVSAQCDECDRVMGMALYEMVKRPVPPGTLDEGRVEPRALGRYCARCGEFPTHGAADSHVLGTLWNDHDNLFDLVEALESDGSKLELKEAKLARARTELSDVEMRRDRLTHECATLEEELGLLKGPPGRDRFAEDPRTAALDDAADDRTRSLPVIRDSRD